MLRARQTPCKTILNKSNLCDFTLNCYVGCSHRCVYCYACYMKKFRQIPLGDWGDSVDVKINAPQILTDQIKKIKLPKEVFMSSICDGWQPLEAKYRLSRACLAILLEAGFYISILTKSSLVSRDFDLLEAYKTPKLGMTITTLNQNLQKALEPYASEPLERLNTLRKAQEKGIKIWVFLGPFLPEFTNTKANLESIFQALSRLNLEQIYVDRLNPHREVLSNLRRSLDRRDHSNLRILLYKCTAPNKYAEYSHQLKENTLECAARFNLSNKLTICF